MRSPGNAARSVAPLVPYAAVAAGLHVLGNAWVAIALYHLGMCLALWLGGGWDGARRALRGWDWKQGMAVAAPCVLPGPLIWILWPHISTGSLASGLAAVGLEGATWWAFVAYYVIANPVLEEVAWRGWLGSPSKGIALSDVLFAGYHAIVLVLFIAWPWILVCLASLVLASWIWRQVARRRGGLAIPVVTHLVADVSVIAAAVIVS